jgi:hypothetical protein
VSDAPIFDELLAEYAAAAETNPQPAEADTAPVDAGQDGDDQPADPGGGQ